MKYLPLGSVVMTCRSTHPYMIIARRFKKPGKQESGSGKTGKTDNATAGNKSGQDAGKKDAGKEAGKNAGKEAGKTPVKNTDKKTPEEKSSLNQEKGKPAPASPEKAPVSADAGSAAPAMKNAVPGDKSAEKSGSDNAAASAPEISGNTSAPAREADSGMGLDRLHVLENEVGSPGTTAPENDTARGGR